MDILLRSVENLWKIPGIFKHLTDSVRFGRGTRKKQREPRAEKKRGWFRDRPHQYLNISTDPKRSRATTCASYCYSYFLLFLYRPRVACGSARFPDSHVPFPIIHPLHPLLPSFTRDARSWHTFFLIRLAFWLFVWQLQIACTGRFSRRRDLER